MNNNEASTAKSGVGYITIISKQQNNKNNKNYNCMDDRAFALLSGPEAVASQEAICSQEGVLVAPSSPNSSLTEDRILRAVFSLFDNGERAHQRYKFSVKLNLTDGTNPEFIANLTKDMRNFRKYIPDESKQEVIDWAMNYTKAIKAEFNIKPYLGKLHLNTKGQATRAIEPRTVVGLYYDYENKGWSGMLCFDEWACQFDLFSEHLSAKQRAAGVVGTELWCNPKHQIKPKAKTWAQQQAERA